MGRKNKADVPPLVLVITALLLIGSTTLIVVASRSWTVPTRDGALFWEYRLGGHAASLLRPDDEWRYFAVPTLHGWTPRRATHDSVAASRDQAVRDFLRSRAERNEHPWLEPINGVTGLDFQSADEFCSWWETEGEGYVWPIEAELRWNEQVFDAAVDNQTLIRIQDQVDAIPWQTGFEVMHAWLLIMLALPIGWYVVRRTPPAFKNHRRISGACSWAAWAALVYVVAMLPRIFLGMAPGASTTYAGPGAWSYSGPYTFYGYNKPGNTVLYRTFLEFMWDPSIRIARSPAGRIYAGMPYWFAGGTPWVAAAGMVGFVVRARAKEEAAPAATPSGRTPRSRASS